MTEEQAEKFLFKRFWYRLQDTLQDLYFEAYKRGKIKDLKAAKKWLQEQERVDAPQVAANRWRDVKLEHNGVDIRLRDWRDFTGKYILRRKHVEDWNEGDEQARLLKMLPKPWSKRVTKQEAKRAKRFHTVKMMIPKDYHKNVVAWVRRNVSRTTKRQSLRNALIITVDGELEKRAIERLDDQTVGGHTIRLQPIPMRMTCDEVLQWVGEEVLKEYKNHHHSRDWQSAGERRSINAVGERGSSEPEQSSDSERDDPQGIPEPTEEEVWAFVAHNLPKGPHRSKWRTLDKGWKDKERKEPRRIGDPPLSFSEFRQTHPSGCFTCYGRGVGFEHDHRTCPVAQADREAYKKLHGSKGAK